MSNKTKINYIRGVTPVIARRILKFVFGDYLLRMKVNIKDNSYDCYLLKEVASIKINTDTVEYFEEYWTGFKLFIVSKED